MSRENRIHHEATSDEAWPFRDATLERRVFEIIRELETTTSGEVKEVLASKGCLHHHGSVLSAMHALESKGMTERTGETRFWPNTKRNQNVMRVRLAVGPVNIGRPFLPKKEVIDAAIAAMRRIWGSIESALNPPEREAVVASIVYLRDLNTWRPRLGRRQRTNDDRG